MTGPDARPAVFTAVASPVEYGYVIAVRRNPHPQGHVPVALAQVHAHTWSPAAAEEVLRSEYGYALVPEAEWQPLEGGRFGTHLRRATGGDV